MLVTHARTHARTHTHTHTHTHSWVLMYPLLLQKQQSLFGVLLLGKIMGAAECYVRIRSSAGTFISALWHYAVICRHILSASLDWNSEELGELASSIPSCHMSLWSMAFPHHIDPGKSLPSNMTSHMLDHQNTIKTQYTTLFLSGWANGGGTVASSAINS